MADKLDIHFLGTGSAIPTKNRNHPSIFIQYKELVFLFDCGEGTQRQIRIAKQNPCKIKKIFITHWHGDHTLGLPGLLQTMALNGYNGILEIHGPRNTKKNMSIILNFYLKSYLERSKKEGYNFKINIFEHKTGIILDNPEIKISCLEVFHDSPCISYSLVLKERKRINKEKLNQFKIPSSALIKQFFERKTVKIKNKVYESRDFVYTESSRKITYITDTRYDKSLINFAKDSNILILESTYSKDDSEIAYKHGHLTSFDAAKIAKDSNSKKLYLIHLSQRYDLIPKKIKEEAKEIYKQEIILVKDFDKIEI